MIVLGDCTEQPDDHATEVIFSDPSAAHYLDCRWVRKDIETRLGLTLSGRRAAVQEAVLPASSLDRQVFVGGAIGSGKTQALAHLTAEQLRAGASAWVVDPKGELFDHLLAAVAADDGRLGLTPAQVTVIDPRRPEQVPGWNPLATNVPLHQAVSDLVAVLERAYAGSWGARLEHLLTSSLIAIGTHQLSLFELSRFLVRDDYRQALLRQPPPTGDSVPYAEVRHFFEWEFAAWAPSERSAAVAAVTNKVAGELLRSPFFNALLCARRNTLALERPFEEQHLVLVRLDRSELGETGARLLAGLLTHLLFRCAYRMPRKTRPVALILDELPVLDRFTGGSIAENVAQARSLGLRVHVAFQHLEQLSEELRRTLLACCGVQAFFRLGFEDARRVAASLAAGVEARTKRVRLVQDGMGEHRLPVYGPCGRFEMTDEEWCKYQGAAITRKDPIMGLGAASSLSLGAGLFVRDPDRGELRKVRDYVRGRIPEAEFWFNGPVVELVLACPRFEVERVERESAADQERAWTRRLQELPTQQCVLRLEGRPAGVVQVATVTPPRTDPDRQAEFLADAVRANGQSPGEVEKVRSWRDQEVARLAGGRGRADLRDRPEGEPVLAGPSGPEADDGSL